MNMSNVDNLYWRNTSTNNGIVENEYISFTLECLNKGGSV